MKCHLLQFSFSPTDNPTAVIQKVVFCCFLIKTYIITIRYEYFQQQPEDFILKMFTWKPDDSQLGLKHVAYLHYLSGNEPVS
jgi:hypothetical protein